MKTLEEIKKYKEFIFDRYTVDYVDNKMVINYYYEIPGLSTFNHKIEIPYTSRVFDKEFASYLAFNIGVMEIVSYYKCAIPKTITIKCGYLDENQKEFFKKIYYYGLGEFFYRNNIEVSYDDFVTINSTGDKKEYKPTYNGVGNMIAIGGGKDSCVTLELLKDEKNNSCFIINPKEVQLKCAEVAGYTDTDIISIKRVIDKNLIKLNEEGYLNGHTPFSAMVAFVSFLAAYLNNRKYIVLSNESSANESNVDGTKINHQYSKTYEFENDFNNYAKKYFNVDIKYFSFLRPLTEYQIGMLFSKFEKYHTIFKSCNVGSKDSKWNWCGKCAKCLFVYTLLSPYLYKDKLINIFGKDLFEDEELLQIFTELIGKGENKPFDCVGTYEEVNYAVSKTIKNIKGDLPYLLKYYKDNFKLTDDLNIEKRYNNENNLDSHFNEILRRYI